MKKLGFVCVLAIAAVLVATAGFAAGHEDLAATNNKAIELFNSGQYEAYFEMLHPDLEAFTGVETPLLFKGKQAWIDFINGLGEMARAQYKETDESVRVHGNTGVINGYFDFTVFTNDGQVVSQGGRSTTTFVKEDGKWLGLQLPLLAVFLGRVTAGRIGIFFSVAKLGAPACGARRSLSGAIGPVGRDRSTPSA